jgi:hypothetical protein
VRVTAKGAVVQARLKHVIDSHGWISADFHVHASASADSQVPMHDRVYEFLAEGVDLLVATDHNVISDYAPLIQELGVGPHLASASGDEITTSGWGHFGAFPLAADLERSGHGAIGVAGRTAKQIVDEVRALSPDAIINVHHPRSDRDTGYFEVGRYDARADRAERAGFAFDYDALEVLNGFDDPERRSFDRVLEDWFALLNHGHVVTATGNSDTHHLDPALAGYPRNYVRVRGEHPRLLDVARAVKGHHSFFTTGPFVDVRVFGAGPGDVAAATGGRARVEITVQAAPWISLSTVRLYVNGIEDQKAPIAASTDVVRYRGHFDVITKQDGWVVVRVDGDQPLSPVAGDARHHLVKPLAVTNPVLLDVDGNGRYDAPIVHGPHGAGIRAPQK